MTVTTSANAERLLTPGEVAALFRVDPKTVTRWASAGRIGSIRTPGGHRRFRESEVREMLADLTSEATVSAHSLNPARFAGLPPSAGRAELPSRLEVVVDAAVPHRVRRRGSHRPGAVEGDEHRTGRIPG